MHEEKQVRGWIRDILEDQKESGQLLREQDGDWGGDYGGWGIGDDISQETGYYGWQPSGGAFYKAFVAPFANVFKQVVNLGKTILNVATFQFTMLFTFAASKQEALMKNFRSRQDKIDGDMEKILTGMTQEAGPDFELVQFLAAPGLYLGSKAALGSVGAAKGIIYNTGLRDAASVIPGISISGKAVHDSDAKPGEDTATTDTAEEPGLISKLERIFFVAHYERPGNLVTEAPPTKKLTGKKAAVDELNSYFAKTGLDDFFAKKADELMAARKEYLDGIIKEVNAQAQIAINLTNAPTPAIMRDVLKKAKAQGFNLGGAMLTKFDRQIKEDIKKILSDENVRQQFVARVLKKKGTRSDPQKKDGGVNEQELKTEITVALTMMAKKKLVDTLYEGVRSLQAQAKRAILEGAVPPAQWKQLSKSSIGQEYVSIHEEALAAVGALTHKK